MQDQFILYNYFRSSASYRVRIALHYKKIPFQYRAVNLVKDGGEQFANEYLQLNPMAQVPTLVHKSVPISQSLAILQYLEDVCPTPALLPDDPVEKALVWQISELINSGMQPLQNLGVLGYFDKKWSIPAEQRQEWLSYNMTKGFEALERTFTKVSGQHCVGDEVTAADCCLIPQVFGALRFKVDISEFQNVRRLYENALKLEAFQLAAPERQPDFV